MIGLLEKRGFQPSTLKFINNRLLEKDTFDVGHVAGFGSWINRTEIVQNLSWRSFESVRNFVSMG